MMICDTKDGDVLLCNSCYQDDEGAELSFWISDDPENYPATCERCGYVKVDPPPPRDPANCIDVIIELPVSNPRRSGIISTC